MRSAVMVRKPKASPQHPWATERGTEMLEYLKTWMEIKMDRRAVTALEYGIIAAGIAIAIISAVDLLGNGISNKFNSIGNSL
jgi:pilus assembly protein Flp/PilA